jgi:hypothetical protein
VDLVALEAAVDDSGCGMRLVDRDRRRPLLLVRRTQIACAALWRSARAPAFLLPLSELLGEGGREWAWRVQHGSAPRGRPARDEPPVAL